MFALRTRFSRRPLTFLVCEILFSLRGQPRDISTNEREISATQQLAVINLQKMEEKEEERKKRRDTQNAIHRYYKI